MGHPRQHGRSRPGRAIAERTALGIIVRSEQIFAGQTLEVAELTDLVIDPPIHNPPLAPDPSLFRPPPGMSGESGPDDEDEPVRGRAAGWAARPGRAVAGAR